MMNQKIDVHELAEDFQLFCKVMLGIEVEWFHVEWVNMFETEDLTAFYAPRGHGKSFTLGVLYPLWKIRFSEINGGPWNFAVISDSLPQSGNIVSNIRRILENNKYMKDLIPTKDTSLHYQERKMELTDGSIIYCVPYSRTAVGIHVDRFLFDEASKVPETDLFWDDLTPIVDNRDGNICVIGTPDHPNDLIDQCMHKDGWLSKTYKAEDKEGNALWSKRFNRERLDRIKKKKGLTSYGRNYMCELTAHGTQVFPPKTLASSCNDLTSFEASGDPSGRYFTGVDLAIADGGDYTVITTVKMIGTDHFKIVDIRRTRGNSYENQLASVDDVFKIYTPVKVLVDESLFGVPFINDLIQRYYIPAEGYNFAPASRMVLINNLVRMFPRLEIPRDNQEAITQELTNELMYELSGLVYGQTKTGLRNYESTTVHDDMIMALALALHASSEYYQIIDVESKATKITPRSVNNEFDDLFNEDRNITFDDIGESYRDDWL